MRMMLSSGQRAYDSNVSKMQTVESNCSILRLKSFLLQREWTGENPTEIFPIECYDLRKTTFHHLEHEKAVQAATVCGIFIEAIVRCNCSGARWCPCGHAWLKHLKYELNLAHFAPRVIACVSGIMKTKFPLSCKG
jgi:hypothetical protein